MMTLTAVEQSTETIQSLLKTNVAAAIKRAAAAAPTADRIAQSQRLKKTEAKRAEWQRSLNDELQERLTVRCAAEGIGAMRVKVRVTLDKGTTYYRAWFTAACLMVRHDYMLDAPATQITAKLFPAACAEVGYHEGLEYHVWRAEFSPHLMKKVHHAAKAYGPTASNCRSLKELAALILKHRTSRADTGMEFPAGSVRFLGSNRVEWFGAVRTLRERGPSKTLSFSTTDAKTGKQRWVSAIKVLTGEGFNVPRSLVLQWIDNANGITAAVEVRKQLQDEAEAYTGSRFHS